MRKFLFHLFIYIKRILKNIIFQAVSLAVLLVGMGITYAAWQTINSSEWAAGQPVTQTLVQKIINNLNDLNTRLSVVNPSGTTLSGSSLCIGSNCKTSWPAETTGGTVTGPLRWSGLQGATTYANAWVSCLALAPTWAWRVPSENEVEIWRHINVGLFSGNKYYWTSSEFGQWSGNDILVFNPSTGVWAYGSDNTATFDGGSIPMELRCVSNV